MFRLSSLLALGAIMWIFKILASGGAPEAQATLALGFLLLAAYLGGLLAQRAGFPRITGYLLTGAAAGPAAFHLVTAQDVGNLSLVGEIAVALIALAAGGKLRLPDLRAHRRVLTRLGGAAIAVPFSLVAVGVFVVSGWLPLAQGLGLGQRAAAALLLGVVMAAGSPAVVLAVLSETRAEGPVARVILNVTVAKDVAVIVLFAAAMSAARALDGGGRLDLAFVGAVGTRLILSILLGCVLGWLASQYLRYVEQQVVLFTVGIAFLSVELARLLHLEALLLTLTAGFFIENIAPVRGDRFVRAIEQSSLPIYAVFFALAGAGVHVDALLDMWPWAIVLVTLRGGGLIAATRWGAAGEPVVARYGWTGLLSQAGVALGLASVLGESFAEWGSAVATLVVAVIAVHELVGPVLFRWGLGRAGEVRPDAALETEPQPVPAG